MGLSLHDELHLVLELDGDLTVWPAGTFSLRVNVAGSRDVGTPAPVPRMEPLPPRIVWSYVSGSRVSMAGTVLEHTDLEVVHDSTDELTRSGYLRFPLRHRRRVRARPGHDRPDFLRRPFRAQRTSGGGGSPTERPLLPCRRFGSTRCPAHHLTSMRGEPVGSSTGLAFQRFKLAHAPVFPGSARVHVTAPGGAVEPYEEVPDLFSAGPNDRVFALLPATGELVFGDGTFGTVPPPDDSGVGGNLVADYKYGGGRVGNVGAGALSQVASPVGVGQLDADNLLAGLGGDDEEAVDEGKARAPAVIRSRYRAVAATDFEALARETPDVRVARANTLANTRPCYRPGMTPGAVTVVLVPHAPFETTRQSPIELPGHIASAVLRYLEPRRLVTTQLFVRAAEYRKVEVDTTLRVDAGASLADSRSAALDSLYRYFHALVGGDGSGWPFGAAIEHSNVFERVLRTSGVSRVEQLRIRLDDGPWLECQDLPIGAGRLLYSGEHIVRVAGVA